MIVVDVETTGVRPQTNGIISIGAINWHNAEQYFYGEARPSPEVDIEDSALDVNGYTREQLAALPKDIPTLLTEFYAWVKSLGVPVVLAGQNPEFDLTFLKEETKRVGMSMKDFPFPYHTIDLHSVAQTDYFHTHGKFYPGVLSSGMIYERLGLPSEYRPHHALNGAVWETEAFGRILLRKNIFADFQDFSVRPVLWQ